MPPLPFPAHDRPQLPGGGTHDGARGDRCLPWQFWLLQCSSPSWHTLQDRAIGQQRPMSPMSCPPSPTPHSQPLRSPLLAAHEDGVSCRQVRGAVGLARLQAAALRGGHACPILLQQALPGSGEGATRQPRPLSWSLWLFPVPHDTLPPSQVPCRHRPVPFPVPVAGVPQVRELLWTVRAEIHCAHTLHIPGPPA